MEISWLRYTSRLPLFLTGLRWTNHCSLQLFFEMLLVRSSWLEMKSFSDVKLNRKRLGKQGTLQDLILNYEK